MSGGYRSLQLIEGHTDNRPQRGHGLESELYDSRDLCVAFHTERSRSDVRQTNPRERGDCDHVIKMAS